MSRDGLVGKPKLGILSYIVQGWRQDGRDVVFVPVSLNYDRVVEDRILVAAGRSAQQRFRATVPEGIKFSLRYLWRRMRGRVGRFGVAAVVFGRPVSLQALAAEHEDGLVERLGEVLAEEIRADLPIASVPLLLASLIEIGRPAGADEVGECARRLVQGLPEECLVFSDDELKEEEVSRQLDILALRHVLDEDGGRYAIKDLDVAAYYANTLVPHLEIAGASVEPEKSSAT